MPDLFDPGLWPTGGRHHPRRAPSWTPTGTASDQSPLDILRDTLTQHTNFKKLNRYLELKEKRRPNKQERLLMVEIAKHEALKPFLPKG